MRLGIRKKIAAGYILVIFLIVLITTGVFINANQQMVKYTRIAQRYHQAEGATMRLFLTIRNQEAAVRRYLFNSDRQFLEVFRNAQQRIGQGRSVLENLLAEDHEALSCLNDRIMPTVDYLDDVLQEALINKTPDLVPIWTSFPGLTEDFIQAEEQLFALLEQRHSAAMFAQREYLQKSFITQTVLIFVLALIAMALGYVIARSITIPLQKLMKGIKFIRDGVYQQIEGVCSNDELGAIVTAFNQMVATIEENEDDLQNRNEELQAQSEELSARNEEILAQQKKLGEVLGKLIEQEQLLNRLFRFAQLLNKTIEPDQLAKTVLAGLLREAPAQAGAFMLIEKESGRLVSVTHAGCVETTDSLVLGRNEGPAGIASRQRQPVVVDYGSEQAQNRFLPGKDQITSEIYLPLVFDDQLLGMIVLGRTNQVLFSPEEQKYLMALADQTVVAVRNALYHQEIKIELIKAQEVDKLKTDLINTVSHELRTPLTSILGFSELLLEKNLELNKTKKYVGMIHEEATRLSKLVSNFLDLQRIKMGRVELQLQWVNLSDLIESIVNAFRGQSTRHAIVLQTEKDFPMIKTDPEQVRRVLENLLSNAIKYSPAGGEVEVAVQKVSGRKIAVAVKDEGLGIPPSEQEKIFQPFYRVDNSDRREIGGSGLGLAIAHQTISALGGELWVESEIGKGSKFTFTLPLIDRIDLISGSD